MNNKIKEFRENMDITQEELSVKVGITRPYLSDLERGKKKPGTEIAMKIAKELNTTVEEIFFTSLVHHDEQEENSVEYRGCN